MWRLSPKLTASQTTERWTRSILRFIGYSEIHIALKGAIDLGSVGRPSWSDLVSSGPNPVVERTACKLLLSSAGMRVNRRSLLRWAARGYEWI